MQSRSKPPKTINECIAMSNICPKGHFSTDQDYCSECGGAMRAAHASAPAASATPADAMGNTVLANGSEHCPECMTTRPAGARFCEACRYDFVNRASFSTLLASAPVSAVPAPTPQSSIPPAVPNAAPTAASTAPHDQTHVLQSPRANIDPASAPAVAAGGPQRLLLRIVVDPSFCTEPDPASPCPKDRPDKVFHLDLDENTLGRQFEGNGTHPEIVVKDPSISRRHLKFVRSAGGDYSVLELGSSNGSEFNGKTLEAGVLTPINPGDQLTLGMWTRIYVELR